MSITTLIKKIKSTPADISFSEVIDIIGANYNYQPTRFTNGSIINKPDDNAGSCKVFAFAQLNQLNEAETLSCFGDYYRQDVLGNPAGSDHANIRNFMANGWSGIQFDQSALSPK